MWQVLFCFRSRVSKRLGPHQAFFDEWDLEGSSWLLLEEPNPCNSTKNELTYECLQKTLVRGFGIISVLGSRGPGEGKIA